MGKPDRAPGRGNLRRRGARVWRDETNPSGSTEAQDEPESEAEGVAVEPPTDERGPDSSPNAGPGSGGETKSAGRAKHHEGLHGGPSRKP